MNHETLAQALDIFGGFEAWMKSFSTPKSVEESQLAEAMSVLAAAARERLAQLPEKCGTCGGSGTKGQKTDATHDGAWPCLSCHGRGTVYPPALVERIAAELHHGEQVLVEFLNLAQARLVTVAVLDALNGETE